MIIKDMDEKEIRGEITAEHVRKRRMVKIFE
jgi:hypothetical protein